MRESTAFTMAAVGMKFLCGKLRGGGGHGVHHSRRRKQCPSRQQMRRGGIFARIEIVVQR